LTGGEIALAQRPAPAWNSFAHTNPSALEKELRANLAAFVRRAYRQRLFISTQGSFSARLDRESFLITPYQEDRGTLDASDLVLVRGDECEAGGTPSRAARIHAAIYRRHPEIGALINAYPVNATAFGVTGAVLDSRTIPESYIVIRQVARVPFGLQFEDAEAMAGEISPRRPAALLDNDGVLVGGADILQAYDRLEVLESTAEAIINTCPIGRLAPMPEEATRELDRVFLKEE
ncbi:MAG: class II aldolase/adducin family protein, partial [Acidobacteriota bacterium]|nr:class II aldolase/adducin family protein [Acidobacteriota bacterium]